MTRPKNFREYNGRDVKIKAVVKAKTQSGSRVAMLWQRLRQNNAQAVMLAAAFGSWLGTTHAPTTICENMNESQAVARLRRNDPNVKDVYLQLRDEDDIALAEALERNDHVNDIGFAVLPPEQPRRWDNLLRVLATREKLETVIFCGSLERRQITVDDAMFLQAVQQNPFVHTVGFLSCDLASGEIISLFLDTATCLTKFSLEDCSVTSQGAGRIAASLQRNTNLQTLSLFNVEDSNLTLILQGLETNTCLQSLILHYQTLEQTVLLAVQHLLERTPSIQSLEFRHVPCSSVEQFRPICQGLIRSTTVSKVLFDGCSFTDANSADSLA